MWGFFIHDEGEPEAETGDVNGTTLNVNAIDVLLDDVLLDGSGLVLTDAFEGGAAEEKFFQQAHREGS